MRFLSALTRHLSAGLWDTGVYEIEQLSWADSVMTLVVRVWGRDDSAQVGWREHLPTVRACFGPDDPEMVAGAWHTGEFYPPLPAATVLTWSRRNSLDRDGKTVSSR